MIDAKIERLVYLIALIAALFFLLAQVGLSGAAGGLLLGGALLLLWRLGVILYQAQDL